jgi:hypothetical protein
VHWNVESVDKAVEMHRLKTFDQMTDKVNQISV